MLCFASPCQGCNLVGSPSLKMPATFFGWGLCWLSRVPYGCRHLQGVKVSSVRPFKLTVRRKQKCLIASFKGCGLLGAAFFKVPATLGDSSRDPLEMAGTFTEAPPTRSQPLKLAGRWDQKCLLASLMGHRLVRGASLKVSATSGRLCWPFRGPARLQAPSQRHT